MINVAFFKHLATGTVAVNATAMFLAGATDNWRIFGIAYAGAACAGYGRIFFTEEEHRMGQHTMGYRSLAMRLRWEIKEEGYQPGQALPSHRQLAERFDTTRITVRRALAILADEKIVEVRHGKGTYVLVGAGQPPMQPGRRHDWVEATLRQWAATRTEVGTTARLAETLTVSPSTVRRVTARLVAEGVLRRRRDGTYIRA